MVMPHAIACLYLPAGSPPPNVLVKQCLMSTLIHRTLLPPTNQDSLFRAYIYLAGHISANCPSPNAPTCYSCGRQ